MENKIELYLGNCLEILPTLADNSVDAVITDIPYGTTACSWDEVIPFDEMWGQVKRVTSVFITTASQPFTSKLIMSNINWFKYNWLWEKSKASNFPHAPNMPLKIFEDICVFSKDNITHKSLSNNRMVYNPQNTRKGKTFVKRNPNTSELKYHRESQTNHTIGYKCKREGYPTTHLKFKSENGLHPTQKPVALYEYLVRTYTNEGNTVLDIAMGSCTTGVACVQTGRNFIGIEIESKYFKIAEKRIAEVQLQMRFNL